MFFNDTNIGNFTTIRLEWVTRVQPKIDTIIEFGHGVLLKF